MMITKKKYLELYEKYLSVIMAVCYKSVCDKCLIKKECDEELEEKDPLVYES